MSRPLIGVCAAVERARWGAWEQVAALLPRTYPEAIERAGGMPVMLPPDGMTTRSPRELLDRLDALIVAGGSDVDAATHGSDPHPETKGTNVDRDQFELALTREALQSDTPLLGICRGMQVLNVAAGGTLEQHLPDRLGHDDHRPVPGQWAEHDVRLEPGSLAARSAGTDHLRVKSHHHQGVDRAGDGIEVTGWSHGDDVIEAIELPDCAFALGVLWHPEEDPDDNIVPAFVDRISNA